MEIVCIEKEVFERMVERAEMLARTVECLSGRSDGKRLGNWMDSAEVCRTLNISMRTLQTMRETGQIGYSRIGYKLFYKQEDVESLAVMGNKPLVTTVRLSNRTDVCP